MGRLTSASSGIRRASPTCKFLLLLCVQMTSELCKLTALCSDRTEGSVRQACGIEDVAAGFFSYAWSQLPKVSVPSVRHGPLEGCDCKKMTGSACLCVRCCVQSTPQESGLDMVKPLQSLSFTCACVWILHYNQWLWMEVDPSFLSEGAEVDRLHMGSW